MIKLKFKNNKGSALVGAVFLMIIVVLLGQAMIYLSINEARREVKSRQKEAVLYVADAGIDKAIVNLQNDNSGSFTGTIGGATGEVGGGYIVDISAAGSNRYLIESTGYMPSTSSWKVRRKIEVEAIVAASEPYMDGIALRVNGAVSIDDSVTIKGGIWSNDVVEIGDGCTITDSEAGAGDGNIYSAYTGGDSVIFTGNASMTGSDPYIKANETVDGEQNVAGNPTVQEYAGLTPIPAGSFPAFDVNSLLDGSQVVHAAHTIYSPGQTLNLDDINGRVHEFQNGVYFDANSVIQGTGTIIVTGGSGDYGIEIDQSMGSIDNYIPVNLCVTGGTWNVSDIYFDQDCYFAGAMVGDYDINVDQSVHIRGVIDCGGSVNVDSDITIEYAEPVWSLPGGSSGAVTIISWKETKP